MEIILLNNDIQVFYVRAASFPQGVLRAHQQLHALLSSENNRTFYGISHPDKSGEIQYMAATTELHTGEGDQYRCPAFTIRKGLYLSQVVKDWCKEENKIKDTFDTLLADSRGDRNGYCLEEYINDDDMRCMVPMDTEKVLAQDRRELLDELEPTFSDLIDTLDSFRQEELNVIPFEKSWTAGMVGGHILKAVKGIPDHQTEKAARVYNEQALPIKKMFLDFTVRFKSPEFVLPESKTYDKDDLLNELKKIKEVHVKTIETKDLHALCLNFELPPFGYLTRYEWLKFIIYHAQRHIHQLKNIYQTLNAPVQEKNQ
jgi:hypothetical protein